MMAIYKIASLNYMTAGSNRAFLNMDTVLGYELYKPVVILRNEEPYISAAVVSAYSEFQTVQDNWNSISNVLSDIGDLTYIQSKWNNVKDEVSSTILKSIVQDMVTTPLSVLCSDIVTEQRDGKWLKTEFLTEEFWSNLANPSIDRYADNAVAALSSSQNILLNERQHYYSELSDGYRKYIRLYPPGSDKQSIKEIENFNKRRTHVNRTFVLDLDLANRRSQDGADGIDSGLNVMGVLSSIDANKDEVVDIVYPMYDIIDVHVKAADKNGKSALKSFDADVTNKREDIYLPQLITDPIGYCQIQSNAYMLTEATALEPGMLESSLHKQRLNRDASRGYTVQIKSNGVKTYIYRKTGEVIDIDSHPQANLAGVEYNNITEFPQNDIKVGYSQGNEYGYIMHGKNAMDSKYNMSLSVNGTNDSVYGCRDYAGIGQFSGNQLYFKFFDGTTYNGISAGSEIQLQRSDNSQFPIVPYQKIECAYINKYTSANLHKTQFFSIKMLNTELNQFENINEEDMSQNDRVQKQLYGQIMQDLGNAIREIVQSLQPSHTQLYRVMFDG